MPRKKGLCAHIRGGGTGRNHTIFGGGGKLQCTKNGVRCNNNFLATPHRLEQYTVGLPSRQALEQRPNSGYNVFQECPFARLRRLMQVLISLFCLFRPEKAMPDGMLKLSKNMVHVLCVALWGPRRCSVGVRELAVGVDDGLR